MMPKAVELTPEQIREHTIRAGARPFVVIIHGMHTGEDHRYLIYAEGPAEAVAKARLAFATPGAARAIPADSAFVFGDVPERSRLS